MMAEGMPEGYVFLPDPDAVAEAVLKNSTWAVMGLILEIELFTQEHYKPIRSFFNACKQPKQTFRKKKIMPIKIDKPAVVEAVGNIPKQIQEFIGRKNGELSIAVPAPAKAKASTKPTLPDLQARLSPSQNDVFRGLPGLPNPGIIGSWLV
jgi:hypothetical protein